MDRRDRLLAAGLALALLAVWVLGAQEPYWSDGRSIVANVEAGKPWSYHLLFYPLANAWARLAGLLGAGTREALLALSAAASAAAVAAVFLAARSLDRPRASALLAALLVATAPVAWFYATTVEVHAPQLLASSLATLWAVRAARRPVRERDAAAGAVVACLLVGAHMAGLPALVALPVLLAREPPGAGRSFGRPRRVALGGAILIAFAVTWALANERSGAAGNLPSAGLARILGPWDLGYLLTEVLVPTGLLLPLAGAALVARLVRPALGGAREWSGPLPVALLLVLAVYLPFAFTAGIRERGGYFLGLVPPLALAATALPRPARRGWTVALVAALLLQLAVAVGQVWRWEHAYPGRAWAEALAVETGDRGILLGGSRIEALAVRCHFRMRAYAPGPRTVMGAGAGEPELLLLVERALERGEPVALTRTLLASELPPVRAVVEALLAEYGPLRPGAHEHYAFLAGPDPDASR